MKYLTLVLLLSNGEIANNAMPSHDCYAAAATMHHAWSVGGRVDRDDGILVTDTDARNLSPHDRGARGMTFRYVPLHLVGEFLALGWTLEDDFADCHHGAHAVLMSREDDHA